MAATGVVENVVRASCGTTKQKVFRAPAISDKHMAEMVLSVSAQRGKVGVIFEASSRKETPIQEWIHEKSTT